MRKMKKFAAMLLALTMTCGMAMTASAAETATGSIKVNGLNANEITSVDIYQVVEHDVENSSWKALEWAKDDVTFGTDDIVIDWNDLEEIVEGNAVTVEKAAETQTAAEGVTEVTFTGLEVGAYLILADGEATSVYSPMGKELYTYGEDGLITVPATAVDVWAKFTSYNLTKELSSVKPENGVDEEASKGTDEFVARGDEVVFDITATFPSFYDAKGLPTSGIFWIKDTPTGLDIDTDKVSVAVAGTTIANTNYTVTEDVNGVVTVEFNEAYIGVNNANAGKKVVVTLIAEVTSEEGYTNIGNASNSNIEPQVNGYTGDITITKYAFEKDNDENVTDNEVLKGARFEVYEGTKAEAEGKTALYFKEIAPDVYKLAKSTEEGATQTIVASNGTVQVKGLDEGTYWFKETKAPLGYTINEDGEEVTLDFDESKLGYVSEEGYVIDTKLIALPSTGGIGTTIFTVAGCGIMIAAAAFFFAGRKKEEN